MVSDLGEMRGQLYLPPPQSRKETKETQRKPAFLREIFASLRWILKAIAIALGEKLYSNCSFADQRGRTLPIGR